MNNKNEVIARIKEAKKKQKAKARKHAIELKRIERALRSNRRKDKEMASINKAIREFKKQNFNTELLENDTMLESPDFKPGSPVFIVVGGDIKEQERIALPVGEYTLKRGRKLVVKVEGIIYQIK